MNVRAVVTLLVASVFVLSACSDGGSSGGLSLDTGQADAGDAGEAYEDAADVDPRPSGPRIAGVIPQVGPAAGGQAVTIRGRGFDSDLELSVGGGVVEDVDVIDEETIRFESPPHDPGEVAVEISQEDGRAELEAAYTYLIYTRVGGELIDGSVDVRVIGDDKFPLEDAYVALAGTSHEGMTDADGEVTFDDPDLQGPQDIVAAAAGYSSLLFVEAARDEIQLVLESPNEDVPPSPPSATLSGEVRGFDELPEPEDNQVRVVQVLATYPLTGGRPQPSRGDDSVLTEPGTYTLVAPVGEFAVVALGGLYHTRTDEFVAHRIGVSRGWVTEADQSYELDLDLNVPLDQAARVDVDGASSLKPEGGEIFVYAYLDFGYEGVIRIGSVFGETDQLEIDSLPRLDGPLEDATLTFQGGTGTSPDSMPVSQRRKRGITDVSGEHALPLLDLPEVDGTTDETPPGVYRLIIDDDPSRPSPNYLRITSHTGQELRWAIIAPPDNEAVRFPEFPDFEELPEDQRPSPYEPSNQLIRVGLQDMGEFDYGNFALNHHLLPESQWLTAHLDWRTSAWTYSPHEVTF